LNLRPDGGTALFVARGETYPALQPIKPALTTIGGDMFTGIGLIAVFSIGCAAALGFFIGRRLLSDDSRSDHTQKTVQMVMTNVSILSALVLGLLVASAKTNFDTTTSEVEQFAASLSLLDRDLVLVGAETGTLRDSLRDFTAKMLALTWPKEYGASSAASRAEAEQILDNMQQRLRASEAQPNQARLASAASACNSSAS
jgi:hypothetical protein